MTISTLPEAETPPAAYRERPARYSVRWPVTISEPASSSHRGVMINIGISGVCILSACRHEIGERVQIRTDVNHLPRLDFTVEITRVQSTTPGWFAYGAKIVTISDSHRHRLRYVLQALQGKQFDRACASGSLNFPRVEAHRAQPKERITPSGYASAVEQRHRRKESLRAGAIRSTVLAALSVMLLVFGCGLPAYLSRCTDLSFGPSYSRLEPNVASFSHSLSGGTGMSDSPLHLYRSMAL